MEDADWHVHLFGHWHNDPDVDRAGLGPLLLPGLLLLTFRPKEKMVGRYLLLHGDPRNHPRRQRCLQHNHLVPRRLRHHNNHNLKNEQKVLRKKSLKRFGRNLTDEAKPIKPLYDFRKVFKKLQSDLPDNDPVMAAAGFAREVLPRSDLRLPQHVDQSWPGWNSSEVSRGSDHELLYLQEACPTSPQTTGEDWIASVELQ